MESVSLKSEIWSSSFLLLTIMSSTSTSTFRPICFSNILFTKLLVGGSCVLEAEGHHLVTVNAIIGSEGCVDLIFFGHGV